MKTITYSKNVFIPLTKVCANNCTYCRFKEPLEKAEIMPLAKIRSILTQAKEAGCKEVLFSSGTQPERVAGFKEKLQEETGFADWLSFVTAACQEALKKGLLPHSNIGVIPQQELKKLADYNASLGLMIETSAPIKAHAQSPTKDFPIRRDMIAAAGELKIPFTSGLLLGVGEDRKDRIESLKVLKELEEEYGHIQEIILQPVAPPQDSELETPNLEVLLDTLELAQNILPASIALQVPPNLVDLAQIPLAFIDDLGGISPLTPDYINPDHQWPKIRELKNKFSDIEFQERLPVYPQYLSEEWIQEEVWNFLRSEGLIDD